MADPAFQYITSLPKGLYGIYYQVLIQGEGVQCSLLVKHSLFERTQFDYEHAYLIEEGKD